jgi:hypothetical protein
MAVSRSGSSLRICAIILSKQCLDDRVPGEDALQCKLAAWETSRNQQQATANWRFSASDARVELECLYPKVSESC